MHNSQQPFCLLYIIDNTSLEWDARYGDIHTEPKESISWIQNDVIEYGHEADQGHLHGHEPHMIHQSSCIHLCMTLPVLIDMCRMSMTEGMTE